MGDWQGWCPSELAKWEDGRNHAMAHGRCPLRHSRAPPPTPPGKRPDTNELVELGVSVSVWEGGGGGVATITTRLVVMHPPKR